MRAFQFALLRLGAFKTSGCLVGRPTCAPATTRLIPQLVGTSTITYIPVPTESTVISDIAFLITVNRRKSHHSLENGNYPFMMSHVFLIPCCVSYTSNESSCTFTLSGPLKPSGCNLNLCNLDHRHLGDDRMVQAAIPSPTIATLLECWQCVFAESWWYLICVHCTQYGAHIQAD